MKWSSILILISLTVDLYAQHELNDTLFSPQGNLMQIKYPIGDRFSNGMIRHYKISENDLDKNKPKTDTIFNNYFSNGTNWSYYDGAVRIFLHNESNVWIGKFTKSGSSHDSCFLNINGVYCFLFTELNNLELRLTYNKDTSITALSLSIYDTLKQGFSQKELFYNTYFDSHLGAKFTNRSGSNLFRCSDLGIVELVFSDANLLTNFLFHPTDRQKLITSFEFYNNYFCKSYGSKNELLPVGEWYYYHENGNVKSYGYYEIIIEKEIKVNQKVGLWHYFDEYGRLTKTEKWNNGKIAN